MNTYAIGQGVDLTFYFRDRNGVLQDPSAAVLKVLKPSGAAADHPLSDATHLGTGTYRLQIVPDVAGVWIYRGESTGTLVAASLDRSFKVEPTKTT